MSDTSAHDRQFADKYRLNLIHKRRYGYPDGFIVAGGLIGTNMRDVPSAIVRGGGATECQMDSFRFAITNGRPCALMFSNLGDAIAAYRELLPDVQARDAEVAQ